MIKDFIYTLFGWKRYHLISYVYKSPSGNVGYGRFIRISDGKLENLTLIQNELAKSENFESILINGIFEVTKEQAL